MKKFYIFGPQNSEFWNKMKSFLAVALMLLMAVGNVNAQVYQKVTDASTLSIGDQIIIANEDGTFALSVTRNDNNIQGTAISVEGDIATITSDVEVLTLEAGTVGGTFALKTQDNKYLYAASSSSNYLRLLDSINDNASWQIAMVSDVMSVAAQGSNTRNNLFFNNQYSLFSAYASLSPQTRNICIYKYVNVDFTVSYEQPENGIISGPTTVNYGEDAAYMIAASGDCYSLTSVLLDGTEVIDQMDGDTLRLTGVVADHTLSATVEIRQYTITATQPENGTITETGTYDCGTNHTYTITPNEGYHLTDVVVDGVSLGAITSYDFNDLNEDHTITADFAIDQFMVSAAAGAHGSITPAGATMLNWHESISFTITPDACYQVASLTVNGTDVTPALEYTIDAVEEDMSIEVTFESVEYDLTWTNIGEGDGTVNGEPEGVFASASCGATVQGYQVTAATGSVLTKVIWNGFPISLPNLDTWTINIPMVVDATNTNIQVEFTLKEYTVTAHEVRPSVMGTATPATQSIKFGHSADITVEANAPAYHIDKIVCGDSTFYGTNDDVTMNYQVLNVSCDTDVYVYFAINEYTITVNDPENGTITPAGPEVTVTHGADISFDITPDACYHIESVMADGTTPMTDYSFTNVQGNHTMDVTFAINEYNMTATLHDATMGMVEGGTVDCGGSFTYTLTANDGYHVDSVVCNGLTTTFGAQPQTTPFIVSNVQNDTDIDVYFSINQYDVTTTANHGTVTPATAVVAHGGSQTLVMNPDDCYELATVTVNDVDVTGDVTYAAPTRVTLLSQDFSDMSGVSGNDNNCHFSNTAISNIGTVYAGWTGSNIYPADQKLKLGSGSNLGWIELPAQDLSACPGEFHVAFDAKAYYTRNSTEQTQLKLIVNGETRLISLSDEIGCELGQFDEVFTGGTAATTIRFEGFTTTDSRFLLDNISVYYGNPAAYTLVVDPITEDVAVVADFSQIVYNVTTSVSAGEGQITPSFELLCGENGTVELTAGDGYHINYYVVNGDTSAISHNNSYTTETITLDGSGDVNVVAAFEINLYTVHAMPVSGQGNITPVYRTLPHGNDATITVDADAVNGYHIVNIYSDVTNVETYGNNTDVTATYTLYNVVSDTTIMVNFALNLYPITVTNLNPDHGTVVPSTQDWEWGQDATFDITPITPCYYISEITVDGTTLDPASYTVTGDQYTFYGVIDVHTLQVNFTDSLFAMTATVNPAGSATVNTEDAHCGEDYVYHIEAAEGQHLVTITVDGVVDTVFALQEDVYDVTIADVHETHNIEITTDIDIYHVTVTTIGEGTTSLDGDYDEPYNTPFKFDFFPDACQELVSFTINDEDYTDSVENLTYTWNASSDAEIVVVYDTIVYNMTATFNAEGGNVTVGTANCGTDYDYVIEAGQGWHITSYEINGVTTNFGNNEDVADTVTVANVSSDTNITVVFERNTYTVTVCDPGNGNTLVADPTTVYYDSTSVITVTAATGYHITSINGIATSGENTVVNETYNVENIQNDTTICAEFALNNYEIIATVTSLNGTITPADTTPVVWGDDMTYTVSSNTPCYYITTVTIDGVDSIVNDSVDFVYTFANIQDNHTIEASFETYTYTVTTTAHGNGTVDPTATLNCGSDFNCRVRPDQGYHIDSVLIDGVADANFTLADSLSYDLTIPFLLADHTIDAYFSINHYLIDVTANANGTITPGDTVLEDGESITYTITPDPCYYISEVLVNGVAETITDITGMTYDFNNVDAAQTLEATFAIYQYAMNETHTGNGTVSTAVVDCGSTYTYNIEADLGWHIVSYEIGGGTTYNTLTEPNDYNTETVVVANASQDTLLTVVFAIDTYTVSACTAVGGTLVVNDPVEVDSNSNTTVTVNADVANGYHIVSITDNRGGSVDLGANTDTTYTYPVNNVDQDIEVCATFALNEFIITATEVANGTITPSGDTTIHYGDVITYTIEPEHPCYYISAITVDGTNVWTSYTDSISPATYTFTAADFDQAVVNHTIVPEFTIFEYMMASNAYTEGTVSSAVVNCGTDYDYIITSNTGYHIDYVVLDGDRTNYTGQQANDVITVTDVQSDHQLDVYFAINHYDIVATAEGHGTIVPAGTTDVEHFSSLTYTITPEEPCYHIADVLVDGASVGAVNTYTFADIDGPHTIHAIFEINRYAVAESHTGNGTVTSDTVNCGDAYQYTMTADPGWHINNHTLGSRTYTLNHNSDVVAYRNVTAVMSDTTLYVEFSRNLYTIDVTSTGNGTTTPGDTTVEFESDVTFTMTPDNGYHVADVLVDGVSVGAVTTYTFDSVAANHTLNVTYEADVYTITASADPHGTITVAGDNEVAFGESINFTVVADDCYHISAILVDGVADSSLAGETVATYVMNNIDTNHTVVAQFEINTYDVTVNTIGNGTATPASATYDCGDDVTFTFTPATGASIESVVVNGQNIGAPTTYTINGIAADYTITVTFSDETYTLTSVSYNYGTITPEGDTTVAYDATMVYTLTPDACQTVSNILVDGVSYLDSANFDGTTLTLNNIQRDRLIQAYFQVKTYTVEATQVDGGVITETGVYDCGTDVVYTITPADCYTLTDVLVDGASVGAVDTYTFAAIDTNHVITATFELNTYTITATAGAGGTITPTDTFDCGETPTYDITPDTGYYVVSVVVDGVDQGAITSYTFASLDADHTIDASFAQYEYTLTVTAKTGVEISPVAGDTTVAYGSTVDYTFTADSCHEIVDVVVDGLSMGVLTQYSFTDIDADHIVTVLAEVKTYTITASVTGEGTIMPAGETTVACGASQYYSFTPGNGYYIEDVLVDGASVGVVTSYTFDDVTADHTIEVIFAADDSLTFTITATATGNGTITPSGAVTVYFGTSQTFVMTPDQYYAIGQVLIDGEPLPIPVATYTFSNIMDNHTIEVVFTEATCPVPTNAWTDDITETTATFYWTDMDATSYTVRYKKSTDSVFTTITGITDNFYVMTGLEEATSYVWNVKSVCIDEIAESTWSAQQYFTTVAEFDTTGIHTFTLSDIRVYSYGNNIYVENNSNEQITDIQVYDMNGRLIHRGLAQSNPTVINVNVANGLYVVKVVTESSVCNYKVSISQR